MVFKKVGFSSFFRDYIKSSLIVSLCFHSVLFFLVFEIWLTWLKFPAEREQGLYSAIREKNNSSFAADSLAQLLKLEYKQGKEKGAEELIKVLHKNFTWFGIKSTYEEFLHFTGDVTAGYLNIKTERDTIIIFVNMAIKNKGKEIDYLTDIIWEKKQNVLKILRKDTDASRIKAAEIPKFKNFFLLWSEMLSILLVFGILVSRAYYTETEYEIVFEIPSSKLLLFVILVLIMGGLICFVVYVSMVFLLNSVFCWFKKKVGRIWKKQQAENFYLKNLSKDDIGFNKIMNEKELYGGKLKVLKALKKKQRELREKTKLEEIVKTIAVFKKAEELENLNNCIISSRLKLEELGNEIEIKQREYFAKQAEKEKLESQPEIEDEKLLCEFKKVASLPEVAALEIVGDKIKIYTGTVRKVYGKKIYILGDYVINLSHHNGRLISGEMIVGSISSIKIENPTSTHPKNKIHPYVLNGGRLPCLGDATSAIYYFLYNQEMYAAVVNIIRILYFYDVLKANPQNNIEEWLSIEMSSKRAKKILEKHKKQEEEANGLF